MTSTVRQAERLGVLELGPYAFEQRMPESVRLVLQRDGKDNSISDALFRLASLLQARSNVLAARLCTLRVPLIHKLAREGETFCGYRNIQMLLQAVEDQPRWRSIFEIQEMIEHAWDEGLNSHARISTGGIKNTRKYIGTAEAEALLQSLGFACTGSSFEGRDCANNLCYKQVAHILTSSGPFNACRWSGEPG